MDEAAFKSLISGEKQGVVPKLERGVLSLLSLPYELAVRARNFNLDRRQSVHRAGIPIVSVGNITTGGTGKTPMVAWLVQWFQQHGVRPVILSRGYRSLPGTVNDEKLVLDQLCPGVPHLQDPDRIASSRIAVEEHGAQVLILDDGFQHRRLARDLDLVLIDALNPFGYGHLLPRGLLREPLSGLRRADLIVITRVDQCRDEEKQQIVDRIAEIRGNDARVEVAFAPECLVNSSGETAEFAAIAGGPVTAFCGIGNPDGFGRTIADCGLQIADGDPLPYPDHYHYRMGDLAYIVELAREQQTAAIVTTQKDLVKINRDNLDDIALWAVRIGAKIIKGADLIENQLNQVIR